jgi:2-methylcitrate dehydratase PrpD
VLGLARKVRFETREYASYPGAFPGGVRITLRHGRTLEGDLSYQLGSPENPMTGEQVRDKFRANAALAGGSFETLEEAMLELEAHADVHTVLSLLTGQVVPA